MKVDKIISIAVINGLTLLIFASLLAGCQKTSIHHSGLFTKYAKQNSRTIASASINAELEKHFDVKQVYIFCKVNDINVEQCFKKNIEVIIKRYEDKNGPLAQGQKVELIRQVNFSHIKTTTEVLAKSMLDKMSTHIGQLVSKRESFCRVNSKFYVKRCLGQYLEKDTMSVLNAYQGHNREMNGHEYLYLKNKIKEQFSASLALSFDKLKAEEKKKLKRKLSHNYNKIYQELTHNRNWLSLIRTFKEASNNCIERVYLSTPGVKEIRLDRYLVSKEIKKSICSDILTDAKVRHHIDKKLYTLLEKKIAEFEKYLEQNKDQKLNIEEHFDKWTNDKENFSHKMYKDFISKRINKKETLETLLAKIRYRKDAQTNISH